MTKVQSVVAITAPTQPLRDAAAKRAGEQATVLLIRPSIRMVREAGPANHSETFCAAICGDGRLDEDYESLFEAIRRVLETNPQAQFFLDAGGARQHAQWRAARQRGLLTNLNFVPRWLGHAELLLTADVLIQPQSLGRVRTLTLQAMGQGLPVIAATDPWLDYLVGDRTAWLLEDPKSADWVELIERVRNDRVASRELGRRSREWVQANCGPAEQAAQLAGLFRRLAGEAIKFGGGET